ncbi:MAG: hypothetical protein ACOYYS_17690 [Chloroflexota bacterium]
MKTKRMGCGCWSGLALVAVLLVPVLWAGYKGSQPMGVADARGMTYWQFMAERARAAQQEPENMPCRVVANGSAVLIGLPYFTVAYIWTGLYPNSWLNGTLTPTPEFPRRPKNLTWSQVPEEAWRLVEELSWGGLAVIAVRDETHSGCGLPPVTYPSDVEAFSP